MDWFENPGWQRHPVARTVKNNNLAVRDLDHNGRPVIKLLPERGRDAWAHPLLLHGGLHLRYHDSLWCYEIKVR
jgi:hypothetical protein